LQGKQKIFLKSVQAANEKKYGGSHIEAGDLAGLIRPQDVR
jgi:hypothetical protein